MNTYIVYIYASLLDNVLSVGEKEYCTNAEGKDTHNMVTY